MSPKKILITILFVAGAMLASPLASQNPGARSDRSAARSRSSDEVQQLLETVARRLERGDLSEEARRDLAEMVQRAASMTADRRREQEVAQKASDAERRELDQARANAQREMERAMEETRREAEQMAAGAQREAEQAMREARREAENQAREAQNEVRRAHAEAAQAAREAQQAAREALEEARRQLDRGGDSPRCQPRRTPTTKPTISRAAAPARVAAPARPAAPARAAAPARPSPPARVGVSTRARGATPSQVAAPGLPTRAPRADAAAPPQPLAIRSRGVAGAGAAGSFGLGIAKAPKDGKDGEDGEDCDCDCEDLEDALKEMRAELREVHDLVKALHQHLSSNEAKPTQAGGAGRSSTKRATIH